MPSAETARLVAELTLKDKMSAGLKTADKNLRSFDKSTANTQKSLSKFGSNVGKAFAIGAAATVAGGVLVVNAAADYEDAFAGIRKTVTETANTSFEDLSDAIRKMSKEIPIAATELAALGEAGGALGVATDDLEEFIRVTALLGQTTDLTAEDAANSLGILSNVLGLTSKDYEAFASSLVALGNAGASTESQIIEIAQRSGAAGELIGLTTDQVLGFSSAIASLGLEAEAGGTAFQNFLIGSSKAILSGGKDLKLFAKVAGKSAKDFQKAFKDNAGAALEDFLAGLGKLKPEQQLAVLDELGFSGARLTQTLLGLANNTELVGSQLDIAGKALEENTALSKEAAERNKTFASQLAITKNVLNDIAITIGTALLPKLTPLLQKFNEFINQNQGQIETLAQDIASAFEQIADGVSKVDWQPFIDGLKFSADVARGAIAAFQAMPDWLQKFIVAGAVANKVTGGLITSLGKDAIKIAFDQFAGKGSNPANPLYVQQVGGVGGAGGAAGGATKGLGTAVQGVVIVGLVQAAAAELAGAVAGPVAEAVQKNVGGGPVNIFGPIDRLISALGGDLRSPLEKIEDEARQTKTNVKGLSGLLGTQQQTASALLASSERGESIANQNAAKVAAQIAAGDTRTELAMSAVRTAVDNKGGLISAGVERVRAAAAATQAAARAAGQQAAFAIRDKDLSVSVSNTINTAVRVSVRETINTQTTHKQFQKFIQ